MNKIKKRIVFKIKTGYKLQLFSLKRIKLLAIAKEDVDQNDYGENVTNLSTNLLRLF